MVDSLATVALETLRDLLVEEVKFLYGVSGEVEEVAEQLKTVRGLLKDADKRGDNSQTMRIWVAKLKKLSIEAENVLERYDIEVTSKRKEAKTLKEKLKRYACIMGECSTVHQSGKQITKIRSRMAHLTDKLVSITQGASSSSSGSVDDTQWSSRRTYGEEVEEHFVGMEDDIKHLASLVKSDERSNQVISICGMGGLGKTTLANKIYQMEAVRRCFEAHAWICISQQFQRKTILQEVLKQLSNEGGEQTEDDLVRELKKVQREKRCLIVLDDIWMVDHWDSLKCSFPIGEKRCKVLLTSRNENIAATEYVYKLKCLSEDEGWELLQKIALPVNYSQELSTTRSKLLEDIGREIVRRCGCLPLPISVLGGILRQEQSQNEWEEVCKNIDSYLQRGRGVEENKNVKQVLDLSYNVLPYNLKPCFLYLGCFPEDEDISTEKLYLLWMAEGMISSEDRGRGETLRDVAERYLSELASRCMVQVKMDELSIYNRFLSCRLHDLLRDLCLSKGENEEFLEVWDTNQMARHTTASSISRLAINLDRDEDYRLDECQHLRSLMYMRKDRGFRYLDMNLLCTDFGIFKYLKIFILEGYNIRPAVVLVRFGIEKLILLKYLSIQFSKLDELPISICKLPRLQALDLRIEGKITLPNFIHEMRGLRHLFLSIIKKDRVYGDRGRSVVGGGKLKLDGLYELETLVGFDSLADDTVDLIKLPKLRVFDGTIHDEESLSMIVEHILNHQNQFRETKLNIMKECNMMKNSEVDGGSSSTLLTKTLMCHSLSFLRIEDCRMNRLPSYEHQFGRNLLRLCLCDCYIMEDPMEMLEKLPMLKELVLWEDAFTGKKMVCRTNGFRQLKNLIVCSLPNLVEWRVDEKAMPNLSLLEIMKCKKLEMIPEGLKFITTLKTLYVSSMPEEFKMRVRISDSQEGEDYHKIKHIPNVTIY